MFGDLLLNREYLSVFLLSVRPTGGLLDKLRAINASRRPQHRREMLGVTDEEGFSVIGCAPAYEAMKFACRGVRCRAEAWRKL